MTTFLGRDTNVDINLTTRKFSGHILSHHPFFMPKNLLVKCLVYNLTDAFRMETQKPRLSCLMTSEPRLMIQTSRR